MGGMRARPCASGTLQPRSFAMGQTKPRARKLQELSVEWVPIAAVAAYPGNPRVQHDVDGIADSIKAFGWRQPIVVEPAVDGVYTIIAGHGRLLAARKNRETHVPIHVAAGLTPAKLRAYRLADNKSAEGAQWDEPKVQIELTSLVEAGAEHLVALAGFDLGAGLDGAGDAGDDDTAPKFEGLNYRLLVDCADESDQAILLERLEGEGRKVRPLIS